MSAEQIVLDPASGSRMFYFDREDERFKWNDTQIPVSQILALTPEKPLVGHVRAGKNSSTHWITFLKGGDR